MLRFVILLISSFSHALSKSCSSVPEASRLECIPESPAPTRSVCDARNCCWQPTSIKDVPFCFFELNENNTRYNMSQYRTHNISSSVIATLISPSFMPHDIQRLNIGASYQTNTRLRIRITDAGKQRYEVPQSLVQRPVDGKLDKGTNPQYKVSFSNGRFEINVTRKDGRLLMKAFAQNFIFADQFLQVSFLVPGYNLYGLGEHRGPLNYDLHSWHRIGLWNRAVPPKEGVNLYGSHPMYVMIDDDGTAHGVALMNSNAMDVTLQPAPSVTWRTTGGILDFYVFTGPTPAEVVQQYFDVIGQPTLPPYWSLGFHLCRWGYRSANNTWNVVKRLRELEFPQEVQWNDIDYMDKHKDFTYDPVNFGNLPNLVMDLHSHEQRYVMILDPAISDQFQSQALSLGNKMHVWVNKSDGATPIEGSVWPGKTYFPDFTNEVTHEWWAGLIEYFHWSVPFDGLWIDMNEPASFVTGSTSGCTENRYDNPPFVPAILDGHLNNRTLCASSRHEFGSHYDLHNLYGHSEGMATMRALKKIKKKKRPFVISRSTFVSSGRYVGHWTGDNVANFENLRYSIAAVVNTNMFGISMTGADICGFMSNTSEELCIRWMQLGSFYTFMRNHNTAGAAAQDPSAFSPAARKIMKKYVLLRYQYLPYLYTQLYLASTQGRTVLTSLAFQFPEDCENTCGIDTQFMWGDSVMVTPVLESNTTYIDVYFPKNNIWYDLETKQRVSNGGETRQISAPITKIPVFVRGGSVLAVQKPELYLSQSRKNAFFLQVFLGPPSGNGTLFWDDGETELNNKQFTFLDFRYETTESHKSGKLFTKVNINKYREMPNLEEIQFFGLSGDGPTSLFVNDVQVFFSFDTITKTLTVNNLEISCRESFLLTWQ